MKEKKIRYVESIALSGSITCVDGTTVVFVEPPQDDEGGAGVREPIRPRPSTPAASVALTLP